MTEYDDDIFNFDEVAEVYKGDNVMDIDTLEEILATDPATRSVDGAELLGTPTDQPTRSVGGTGHAGPSEKTAEDGWDVGEWKDTADHWKWILDEDGWWKNAPEGDGST